MVLGLFFTLFLCDWMIDGCVHHLPNLDGFGINGLILSKGVANG